MRGERIKMAEESVVKHINENPDSLEIGTPSKGGVLKVYGSFADEEAFKAKIEVAVRVRAFAVERLG